MCTDIQTDILRYTPTLLEQFWTLFSKNKIGTNAHAFQVHKICCTSVTLTNRLVFFSKMVGLRAYLYQFFSLAKVPRTVPSMAWTHSTVTRDSEESENWARTICVVLSTDIVYTHLLDALCFKYTHNICCA